MPGMIEVAKATVTIVPNMEGSQRTITEDLTGVASSAGTKAGAAAGTNMAKGIGKAIAGTAIAAKVGKGIADSWKEVDAATDTIVTKTGATGEALEGLADSMRRVATSVPTDFQAAGDAIGEVNTKFGLTGDTLEDLSTQFIKFAAINNTDVSTSIDTVANTLAAFGEDSSNASAVLDAMTAAGQATGIGMDELGNALQKNAATFNELGMSVEDAAGLMATFNKAGLMTADASTALRTAWKNAAKDGVSLNEAIAEFGETMNSSASATEKQQAAIDLFGAKAGAAIYNAFANGTLSIEAFTSSMSGFGGLVSSTFEETLDPTDRFQQAMNSLKSVGADIVEAFSPALTAIAETVTPVLSKAAEAFGNLPKGAQAAVLGFAGVAAAAGPVASIGGKIGGAISSVAGHFGSIGGTAASAASGIASVGSTAATAASGAASAASGFGAMAGGALQIVALGAALALAGAGLKQIAEGAVMIGQGGAPAGIALAGLVVSLGALMGLAAALGPALTAGALGIGVFGAAVLAIGGGIDLACTGIARLTDSFTNLVTQSAASADGINQIISQIGTSIEGIITSVGSSMSGVLNSFAGVIDSIGQAAVNGGEGFKRLAEGVSMIVSLNLLDLGASMASVAAGIGKISAHSDEISTTSQAITNLQTALSAFGQTAAATLPAFSQLMDKAKATVKQSLAEMAETFKSTKFEFGAIKLPHFKMSGNFDAKSGSVPKVSVDWYAQAAEKGALFTSPQIIGVGDSSQPEMLIGEKTLQDRIAEAVGNNNGGDVYVYIGETQLDAIIQRSTKRTAMRSGGH